MPLHKRQGAEIFYGWIRPCGVFYLVQIAISQARRLVTWLEMNGVSAQKKTAALDVHERCYYGRPCGVFFFCYISKKWRWVFLREFVQ